jgi:D-beta-D-heptose 7-phosphate kinase / D-beta-D-heptose 1-phosphate adenosyltransferase
VSRIVVLGDALLDRDIVGAVGRLCPDAPVPVLEEHDTLARAGGAGLAAVLARRSGHDVTLVCPLADDDAGRVLRDHLGGEGIETIGLASGGSTTEKIRLRAGDRTLLRLDRGSPAAVEQVPVAAADAVLSADALLVADYGGGVTAHADVRALVERAIDAGVPVVWDPHPRGSAPVRGVALLTPNRAEAMQFLARCEPAASAGSSPHTDLSSTVRCAERLRRHWQAEAVAVTMGSDGAVAVGGGHPVVVPIDGPAATGDPCGAGDAFAVASAAAFARGSTLSTAVSSAVDSAASFVHAGGAASIHVLSEIEALRATRPTAEGSGSTERPQGGVVATGGCFDVIHAGHVALLQRARALGDRLVVLLNSDRSVAALKGEGRPVQREGDRAAVLRSLGCVDEVVVFDELTPAAALRALRPHLFVKGGDYADAPLPEAEIMAEWGGLAVTVPLLEGRSTTRIVDRIRTGGAHVG